MTRTISEYPFRVRGPRPDRWCGGLSSTRMEADEGSLFCVSITQQCVCVFFLSKAIDLSRFDRSTVLSVVLFASKWKLKLGFRCTLESRSVSGERICGGWRLDHYRSKASISFQSFSTDVNDELVAFYRLIPLSRYCLVMSNKIQSR